MWAGSKGGPAPNLSGSIPYPCPGDKWEEGSSLVEQIETVNPMYMVPLVPTNQTPNQTWDQAVLNHL